MTVRRGFPNSGNKGKESHPLFHDLEDEGFNGCSHSDGEYLRCRKGSHDFLGTEGNWSKGTIE